ncbi:Endoplasmic reticulum transmembrane protein 2 [Spathaspora sp. JA1]|nr:Endoplasmic reticulum transmembrane protein 2 [Spathaspora sp. JA1]
MVVQMVVLLILVLPLPQVIRQKIVNFSIICQNSSNFRVGVIFSLMLMTLQFFDCLKRLQRYSGAIDNPYFENSTRHHHYEQPLNYDQLASKFYAQRNLYLSGAILYLMMAIATVMTIVKKMVSKEAEYRELTAKVNDTSLKSKEEQEKIEELQQLIDKKQLDIDTFKKQISGLQAAYNELSPEIKSDLKEKKSE